MDDVFENEHAVLDSDDIRNEEDICQMTTEMTRSLFTETFPSIMTAIEHEERYCAEQENQFVLEIKGIRFNVLEAILSFQWHDWETSGFSLKPGNWVIIKSGLQEHRAMVQSVSLIGDTIVKLQLPPGQRINFTNAILKNTTNITMFNRMRAALDCAMHRIDLQSKFLNALGSTSSSHLPQIKTAQYSECTESLNSSQMQAVMSASQNCLTIIHGPVS